MFIVTVVTAAGNLRLGSMGLEHGSMSDKAGSNISWIQGLRASGFDCRVQDFRFDVKGLGFRI